MDAAADRDRDTAASRPTPPRWLIDIGLAAVVAVAGFAPIRGEVREVALAPVIPVAVAAALVLLRRRWPVAVLAGEVAVFGIAALTWTLTPGVVIAAAIAAFTVADHLPRRPALIIAGSAVLLVAAVSVVAALQVDFDVRVFAFALAIAFAAAAGDGARSRREYIWAMTERAERAERTRASEIHRQIAEERLRIARDLHDVVAHQISVISLNAGVVSSTLDSQPDKAKLALATIRGASRSALAEIGDLLGFLRADDAETSAAAPPQAGLDQLDPLLRRLEESGLRVTLRSEGDLARLTGAIDAAAFRVIQEGLTNAHKHGAEERAHVLIDATGHQARIVITNPVPDTLADLETPADSETGRGLGLLGLRERVGAVGGALSAGGVSAGYRLLVTLPLPDSKTDPKADPEAKT